MLSFSVLKTLGLIVRQVGASASFYAVTCLSKTFCGKYSSCL